MKNIIIIEDSAFFRTSLVEKLSKYSDIKILGTANDGLSGIKLFATQKPDVVVLDLVLPKVGGDAVAESIMNINPTPIILITSLTDFEIEASFQLNLNYFVDILKKPIEIDDDFVEKLYKKITLATPLNKKLKHTFTTKIKFIKEFSSNKVFVIGSSTGGPKTLKKILPEISKVKNLPTIILNHTEVGFENNFKSWLQSFCKKGVEIISNGLKVEDKIYIAPTVNNFKVKNDRFYFLPNRNKKQLYFPDISEGYKAVAEYFKEKTVIFQMTGMGYDGKEGIKFAKEHGAKILVQDPETAVAPSMPHSVIRYADYVIKVEEVINFL